MLLNLALEFLGTAVTCDKVSSDSYECTNLMTTDFMTRRRGYVAEHFIKPPVHITFTFPCNFNISHVVLDPYVGQQQSLQIDLLCATKPTAKTSHGKFRQQLKASSNSHQSLATEDPHLPAFYLVSRVSNCARSRICFYSSRYQHRVSNNADRFQDYQIRSEMRHSRAELLTCASHIMIKIVRTQKGSTPAVGNIEIWGSISSSVYTEVKKSLEEKYICFITPAKTSSNPKPEQNGAIQTSSSSSSCSSEKKTNLSSDERDGIEIPEEFLDPLTFEMMTIPMILPCGKNVDKSSLDRFSDSEASNGRHPRDPFTGVEFSSSIKPIPNGDLKARIDSFLMSNSNVKSVATIPRTVSAGKSSCVLGKRKLDDKARHVSLLVAGNNTFSENSKDNFVNPPNISRSATPSSPYYTVNDKLPPVLNHSGSVKDSPSTSKLGHQMSSPKNDFPNSKSHDAQLKDSLDNALSSILASFSSVKNAGLPTISSDSNRCLKCGLVFGTENTVYKTPCSHFICRECLLSYRDQEIRCSKCNTNFKKVDVVRSH